MLESKDLKQYLSLTVEELYNNTIQEEELRIKQKKDNDLAIQEFKESVLKQEYWLINFNPDSRCYVKILNNELKSLSVCISKVDKTIRYTIEKRDINILWFNVKHLYPNIHCSDICSPCTKEDFEKYYNIKDLMF